MYNNVYVSIKLDFAWHNYFSIEMLGSLSLRCK